MKIVKYVLPYIVGAVTGYIITEKVFSELIPILFGTSSKLYPVLVYGSLVASAVFFTIICQMIVAKHISKPLFILLYVMYFAFLMVILFDRSQYEGYFIINPLKGLENIFTSKQMLAQSLMNALAFVPMGYYFRKRSRSSTIIITSVISFVIELMQYVFKLGFFDTFDIILYVAGNLIGRFISNKISIDSMLKDAEHDLNFK